MERAVCQPVELRVQSGTHNVHVRLAISILIGGCAAVVSHGQSSLPWIAVGVVALLAVGAGVGDLWSP
jgi:hypothetical protein